MRPRKGDRFRAVCDVTVRGIVTYSAPFSTAFTGTFPMGSTCQVDMDPPAGATGVYLMPEEYERFELLFVSPHDRNVDVYDSYAMAVSLDELSRHFERIEST